MDQPLDINLDLSDTKTAVPLIADNSTVELSLANVTLKTGDKGKTLVFEWRTTAPVPDSEGGTIEPGKFGSFLFDNIQLYAKEGAKDPKWFEKKIASRVDALLGTADKGNKKGKSERPAFNSSLIPQLIGKKIVAKVRINTSDAGYQNNNIQTAYFPGDIAA